MGLPAIILLNTRRPTSQSAFAQLSQTASRRRLQVLLRAVSSAH